MRSRWLIPLVGLAVVAAACSGGGGGVATKHKVAPTSTTQGPPVAPLTGLTDNAAQALTRPALSVKIENTPDARPQTGLDAADVVYEQQTEAGITRFMAVFNSNIPPVVGPVRSARIMDPDLFVPLGGIFVYSGAIQPTVAAVSAAPGVNVIVDTGSDPALFRDRTKQAPHNLYGHADQLLARGGKPVPPPALFSYLPRGTPFNGDQVQSFTVNFNVAGGADQYRPTYTYDQGSNTWKRAIGLTPFMDTDGQQDAPTNVIVEFVGCCLSSPESGNFQTVGNGDAWIFSNGKVVKGKWSRSDRSQVTQFTDANGTPVKLTPGKTWVELAPNDLELGGVPIVAPPNATTTVPSTAPPPTTAKKKK